MSSRTKIFILSFIVVIYFSIVAILFVSSIKMPFNMNLVPSGGASINSSSIINYFNPYSLSLKNTSSVAISSGNILESHIEDSFLSIISETIEDIFSIEISCLGGLSAASLESRSVAI